MARISLIEVKRRYVVNGRPLDGAMEAALRADPRAGARAILTAIEQRRFQNRAEGQRLRRLLRYEWALWNNGVVQVAGVDEAGMSPLAGPVAAGAVVFPRGARVPGVDDSKKLCAAERERLAAEIKREAVAWSVGFADVAEIDTLNIYWASQLAMKRAVAALSVRPEHVLIDGRPIRDLGVSQQPIIGGDAKSLTIAAASILAKTARDALMRKLDADHPGYGFAQHKGYGVPGHLKALRALGACPLHRTSFGPVRAILGLPPLPPWPESKEALRQARNRDLQENGPSRS